MLKLLILISEVVAEDSDKSLLRLMVLGKLGSALERGERYRTRKERRTGQKRGRKDELEGRKKDRKDRETSGVD
jgi:hypothetical protein